MVRKRRFRFGLPIVFAGARLSAVSALAVSQFGPLRRPGSARLAAYCPIQKARGGFSGTGLILATVKICR
jgi:hypothetical protein